MPKYLYTGKCPVNIGGAQINAGAVVELPAAPDRQFTLQEDEHLERPVAPKRASKVSEEAGDGR